MPEDKKRVPLDKLKRSQPIAEKEPAPLPISVSAGTIDKIIDFTFNPSRDKIREVTIIDRLQGRLFPQIDMINYMRHYCLEVAHYRQNPTEYKQIFKKERPIPPEPLDEFMFRTAQWQKSVAGKNLERATDIALAETEARIAEKEMEFGEDAWKD